MHAVPASASAWATAGRVRWALGDDEGGIDRLNEALRLDPTSIPVRLDLADAMLDSGRAAEAVRVLAPLDRLDGDDQAARAAVDRAQAPKP